MTTGISNAGVGLPSAQALFAGSGAPVRVAEDPGSLQPGFTVQGPDSSTTLPSATPGDFAGVNPTPLDTPHPEYLGLIKSHVAVLQAIGTPASVIAQINAEQPQAQFLERYIQSQIMQNPEGWDAAVGNPAGTARAGLRRLMPSVQLPAPGTGAPGTMPDGSQARIPGVSSAPATAAPGTSSEKVVKGLVWTAAAVGVGLLGWKLWKGGGGGASAAVDATASAAVVGAGAGAGTTVSGGGGVAARTIADGLQFDDLIASVGTKLRGGSEIDAGSRLALAQLSSGGGVLGEQTSRAASLWAAANGFGPAEGHAVSTHMAAKLTGMSERMAHTMAMESRWLDIIETGVKNGGSLADAMAMSSIMRPSVAGAGAAAGSGVSSDALRQALLSALNVAA